MSSYVSLDSYSSFTDVYCTRPPVKIENKIENKIEHYTDIIAPHYFPPLYSFSSHAFSIKTHRFSLDEPIKPFHQKTREPVYGDQEMVVVTIPPDSNGYRFYTDCCKLDAWSYVKQHSILDAVAINGVFYQFHIDSVPLGGYKQGDREIVRDLQPVYAPFYHPITICKEGRLRIHSETMEDIWKIRDQFHSVMACAPLLIDQGAIVFTDDMVESSVVNQVHILKCDINKSHERGMEITRGSKRIKSCSTNLPGGLFHSSNANPRSALVTSQSGTVYLVRVAGRMPGVMGMDLIQTAQSIKRIIPDAWMAINLDGGAPSQIVHKHQHGVMSTTNQYSSADSRSTIMIGNLISYMKVTDSFRETFDSFTSK
jgi:hypothetical protein